jgi:Predicted nucleotide-binding protein containing TIR -like domain
MTVINNSEATTPHTAVNLLLGSRKVTLFSENDAYELITGQKRLEKHQIQTILNRLPSEHAERMRRLRLEEYCVQPLVAPTAFVESRVNAATICQWQKLYKQRRFIEILVDAFLLAIRNESIIQNDILNSCNKDICNEGLIMDNKNTDKSYKGKIFIVHGHDDAAKEAMARIIERIGYKPIILHEQADEGDTIIEKIEKHSNVNFAVVLYTECDLGRAKNAPINEEKNRARQNVVFEHGYLLAKLGREKVCALVKGEVETPGDISGVVYTKMLSDGGWKIQLLRNMQAAGLDVNANCLI